VTVPAGDYLVTSSGMGFNEGVAGAFPNYDGEMHCALTSANDGTHNVGTFATVPKRGYNAVGTDAGGTMNVTLTSGFHLPSGGTVTVTCDDAQYSEQKPLTYSNIHITAVQVATLHP
jgi:hypothetical protein